VWVLFRTSSNEHISSTSEPFQPTDDYRPTLKPSPRASPVTVRPTPNHLLESGVVFRLEDFALYRVSSAIDERRSTPRKFISSDKKQLLLPKSMSSVHFDFTDYYFPDGKDLPGEFLLLPLDTFVFVFLFPIFRCSLTDVTLLVFDVLFVGRSSKWVSLLLLWVKMTKFLSRSCSNVDQLLIILSLALPVGNLQ